MSLESSPLYEVVGCPLFRGCLSIEVNGRTVGTSELSVILWVSTVEECRRVPLTRTQTPPSFPSLAVWKSL